MSAGKERAKRMQRVLQVQERLHQVAQWRLSDIEREARRIEETQAHLLRTLAENDPASPLPLPHALSQLRSLAGAAARVEEDRKAQQKVVFEKAMQEKRAARMAERAQAERRREGEKADQAALLDLLASRIDASPRKG